MKVHFVLMLCLGLTLAEIDTVDPQFRPFKRIHQEQHKQTIAEAQKELQEKLGTSGSINVGHLTGTTNVGGIGDCITTCGGGATTIELGSENFGTGYGGINEMGFNTGSESSHTSSSSSHGVSGIVSSGSESSSHLESSSSSVSQTPVHIPLTTGGAESHYEYQGSKIHAAPLPYVIQQPSGSESSYSSQKIVKQQSAPIIIQQPSSSGSESHYHHSSQKVINQAPVYIPSGGSTAEFARYEKKVEAKQQPAPIHYRPSESYHESSHKKVVQSVAPQIVVQPTGGSESYFHESSHKVHSAPTFTYTPTGGSSSLDIHSQKIIKQAPTMATIFPSIGGSESLHKESHISKIHTAPQINYIPAPSGGSESSYYHKKVTSSSSLPVYQPVITGGTHSSLTHLSSNSGTVGGGSLLPGGYGGAYTTGGYGTGSSLTTGGFGFGTNSGFGMSSSNSLHSGSHFGSSWGHGSGSFGHSDLHEYMSESERLARLQAQQAGSQGVIAGGSQINSGFGTNAGLTHGGLSTGSGGYSSKSWEKSSKWQSGTEYGTDGTPKHHKLISTAESEHVNLNGKEAGYKAATTTVGEDGKVSTYSIHT